MQWKKEAIEKLEQYEAKKQALRSLPEQIKALEIEAQSIRPLDLDGSPVRGSGGGRDDRLLNNIVHREELERNLKQARIWVGLVDAALSLLNNEEREILTRFYIRRERGAADSLAGRLHCDVKTVYHRKDSILRKFTISLYGGTES